jgi:Flp pilus assembly protein TadD
VEIVGNNQIVIHSLAGRGRDLANRNMTEAEQRLKAGKFYEASDAYEMAASLNLRNPLPHVGRALALLGAGEPASAAAEIRAALDVFPPLMEARMDLGGMMNLAVLRSRLAELDARLKQSEPEADSLLPFLACYLHYQVDDTDQAKTYANQIRSGDSKNKMVKAFAEFVLTGHRPRSQAQTQPASAPATAPAKAGEITPPAP